MDAPYITDVSEVLNPDLPSKSLPRTPERSLLVKLNVGESNKVKLANVRHFP
jgi:hypothetical protein